MASAKAADSAIAHRAAILGGLARSSRGPDPARSWSLFPTQLGARESTSAMAKGEPLCCVSASPRSRHAQRSHCSTIILPGGKHSAADVVASRKPTSPRPNYCGRCLMSATSRRTRRRSRMSARPDCKFQLTEASSTTPQCCPLAESLRLLAGCIRMPSIFRAFPTPQCARPG